MNQWFGGQRPAKFHGLENQGSTCYLNSVLQVLFMTEDFKDRVKRHNINNEGTEHIDSELTDLFTDLEQYNAYTYKVTKKLKITNVYEQRDAAEHYEKILRLTSPEASQIFRGELINRNTCHKCETQTESVAGFWHLPLPLVDSKDDYSVVKGIEDFFRSSVISGENQMYCEHCDDKCDASLDCEVKHHPEVLVLLLKRFEFDYSYMSYVKINRVVEVPYTLHIPKKQVYELYACVEHSGELRCGHYISIIKSQDDGKWYIFNDSSVRMKSSGLPKMERSQTAYLLFYRKHKGDISEVSAPVASEMEVTNQIEDTPITLDEEEEEQHVDNFTKSFVESVNDDKSARAALKRASSVDYKQDDACAEDIQNKKQKQEKLSDHADDVEQALAETGRKNSQNDCDMGVDPEEEMVEESKEQMGISDSDDSRQSLSKADDNIEKRQMNEPELRENHTCSFMDKKDKTFGDHVNINNACVEDIHNKKQEQEKLNNKADEVEQTLDGTGRKNSQYVCDKIFQDRQDLGVKDSSLSQQTSNAEVKESKEEMGNSEGKASGQSFSKVDNSIEYNIPPVQSQGSIEIENPNNKPEQREYADQSFVDMRDETFGEHLMNIEGEVQSVSLVSEKTAPGPEPSADKDRTYKWPKWDKDCAVQKLEDQPKTAAHASAETREKDEAIKNDSDVQDNVGGSVLHQQTYLGANPGLSCVPENRNNSGGSFMTRQTDMKTIHRGAMDEKQEERSEKSYFNAHVQDRDRTESERPVQRKSMERHGLCDSTVAINNYNKDEEQNKNARGGTNCQKEKKGPLGIQSIRKNPKYDYFLQCLEKKSENNVSNTAQWSHKGQSKEDDTKTIENPHDRQASGSQALQTKHHSQDSVGQNNEQKESRDNLLSNSKSDQTERPGQFQVQKTKYCQNGIEGLCVTTEGDTEIYRYTIKKSQDNTRQNAQNEPQEATRGSHGNKDDATNSPEVLVKDVDSLTLSNSMKRH